MISNRDELQALVECGLFAKVNSLIHSIERLFGDLVPDPHRDHITTRKESFLAGFLIKDKDFDGNRENLSLCKYTSLVCI